MTILHDPVTNDLIRHIIETDHEDAHAAEVNLRVDDYLTSIHGRNTIASDAEVMDKMDALFACVCAARTECSIKVAVNEVHAAAVRAATRHAIDDMKQEQKDAYELGWRVCAKWAKRDDLHFDVGTEAYCNERDAAIDAAMKATK
jgi:hypothetical protein